MYASRHLAQLVQKHNIPSTLSEQGHRSGCMSKPSMSFLLARTLRQSERRLKSSSRRRQRSTLCVPLWTLVARRHWTDLHHIQIQAFSISVKVILLHQLSSPTYRLVLFCSICSGGSKASTMTTSTLLSPSFHIIPMNPAKRQVMNMRGYHSFAFAIKVTAL